MKKREIIICDKDSLIFFDYTEFKTFQRCSVKLILKGLDGECFSLLVNGFVEYCSRTQCKWTEDIYKIELSDLHFPAIIPDSFGNGKINYKTLYQKHVEYFDLLKKVKEGEKQIKENVKESERILKESKKCCGKLSVNKFLLSEAFRLVKSEIKNLKEKINETEKIAKKSILEKGILDEEVKWLEETWEAEHRIQSLLFQKVAKRFVKLEKELTQTVHNTINREGGINPYL